MKTVLKIKTWPLLITGLLVWVLGTVVPIANDIAERLDHALTEKSEVVLAAITNGGASVMAMLGPLRPTRGSFAEVSMEVVLVLVPVSVAGLFIGTIALWSRNRHSELTNSWVCSHCRAGQHRLCRGALLFVSRANGGAEPCRCEECALNRN